MFRSSLRVVQIEINTRVTFLHNIRMSKRKGPSDENQNGEIVDFLMGIYPCVAGFRLSGILPVNVHVEVNILI